MPKRQLRTPQQAVQGAAGAVAQPRQVRAFLVGAYPLSTLQGSPAAISVTLTDPTLGPRGAVLNARVRAGLSVVSYAAGQPVFIQFNHGKAEIVSFG